MTVSALLQAARVMVSIVTFFRALSGDSSAASYRVSGSQLSEIRARAQPSRGTRLYGSTDALKR